MERMLGPNGILCMCPKNEPANVGFGLPFNQLERDTLKNTPHMGPSQIGGCQKKSCFSFAIPLKPAKNRDTIVRAPPPLLRGVAQNKTNPFRSACFQASQADHFGETDSILGETHNGVLAVSLYKPSKPHCFAISPEAKHEQNQQNTTTVSLYNPWHVSRPLNLNRNSKNPTKQKKRRNQKNNSQLDPGVKLPEALPP